MAKVFHVLIIGRSLGKDTVNPFIERVIGENVIALRSRIW
ncbi:hypothetical protein EC917_112155 [Bacillus thuringiensis]|uniref:Uncharacterized protein n=2 Tax=Bacillus cereus group TaxID=86661 RepID=A0A4R4BCG3_BACTU|nr:hypothetical protein IC1_05772 [Bacillus cereus VD022]EOQ58603.1 hypothetical protein IAY_05886 [Bacillus cereus TIAC219]TCW53032.1 hypothetical protein EC917_112155 [Bacillus thuringiensis]TCW53202.1 hypothetical protein EC910_112155 [Bacillus thuringiensis]SPT76164.1 Uncharacterised protein [Bacillus cereus]